MWYNQLADEMLKGVSARALVATAASAE